MVPTKAMISDSHRMLERTWRRRHAHGAQQAELAGALGDREQQGVDHADDGDDEGEGEQHVDDEQELVGLGGLRPLVLADVLQLGAGHGRRRSPASAGRAAAMPAVESSTSAT